MDLIDRFFPKNHANVLLGRGDDSAVITCAERLCIATDLFIEKIHFHTDYFSPRDIGYKSLAVNLNDLAAMGARPTGFTMGLMVRGGLGVAFWQDFFHGMAELAAQFDLPLAGGDLSRASCLGVGITAWGEAPADRLMTRGSAQPGDLLFLLGPLGLARAGLQVLEARDIELRRGFPQATQAHLRPRVWIAEAQSLAAIPEVRGLMDVSDGLARDLPRFLGPERGAEIAWFEAAQHPEMLFYTKNRGYDPLEFALCGGEDYAILGAVQASAWRHISGLSPAIKKLGRVTSKSEITLHGHPLNLQGFDHFHPGNSQRTPR